MNNDIFYFDELSEIYSFMQSAGMKFSYIQVKKGKKFAWEIHYLDNFVISGDKEGLLMKGKNFSFWSDGVPYEVIYSGKDEKEVIKNIQKSLVKV